MGERALPLFMPFNYLIECENADFLLIIGGYGEFL